MASESNQTLLTITNVVWDCNFFRVSNGSGETLDQFSTVTQWIENAREGDESALAKLHRRYWKSLVRIANRKLEKAPPSADRDAEDVAQLAFIALHRSIKRGQIPDIKNRSQFLAFLSSVIACKAINEIKRTTAKKRGSGRLVELVSPEELCDDDRHSPLQNAILNDCYAFYIEALPKQLQSFAELHLAGLSNREIAVEMSCVERTVERKLALLRQQWKQVVENGMKQDIDKLLVRVE